MTTRIYGFSLIRNGVMYDYPFHESFQTLSNLCEKVYIACGESEDQTEEVLKSIKNTHIIPTKWDLSKRTGGLILSEQTNIALQNLRESEKKGWGIYLQADEVFSEQDYELIRADIEKADQEGFDCVRFRYMHFWERYDNLLIGKRWYPHEIRAVKLDSQIESWGDAQGFRNFENAYESEATVYHYGHVREPSKYELKMKNFHALYHDDEKVKKVMKKAEKEGKKRKTITYLGPHPSIMNDRMGPREIEEVDKVYIVADEKFAYPWKIHAKEVVWVKSKSEITEQKTIVVEVNEKLFSLSKVPKKMDSKLARAWSQEFILLLKLSEKGVHSS